MAALSLGTWSQFSYDLRAREDEYPNTAPNYFELTTNNCLLFLTTFHRIIYSQHIAQIDNDFWFASFIHLTGRA